MRFLTWANDPSDPRCELLFKSAKHFGIDVEPIGVGKEYRGGVSKIEWLAEWLEENSSSETIVCTDAYDCLYLRHPPDDINIDSVEFASQRWYRGQDPARQGVFDQVYGRRTYRYIDPGIVVGRGTYLSHLYSLALQRFRLIGGTEKERWWLGGIVEEYLSSGSTRIRLDSLCELFYCCGGEWRRFAGEVVEGRFRNKRTGTYPYILHAPIPRRSLPIRERVARELGII